MLRTPPTANRTDTRCPYTALFRCGRRDWAGLVVEEHVEQRGHALRVDAHAAHPAAGALRLGRRGNVVAGQQIVDELLVLSRHEVGERAPIEAAFVGASELLGHQQVDAVGLALHLGLRSEEHTSELPSLMRISYAVFCLQKQNHTYF